MTDIKITDKEVDGLLQNIIRELIKDGFVPDYIVGLTRGGLIPAVKLSHYLNVPMDTLNLSLTNGTDIEFNGYMPEDAFGYTENGHWDILQRKKILIIDDINDTGNTFTRLVSDWQDACLPKESSWETVWHKNVRFATLIENTGSNFSSDYSGKIITKEENDWVIFSWENWWNQ